MKIYKQGLEESPKSKIIFGNLLILLWIGLGIIACGFLSSLIAWIYLIFSLVMVFIVLRKLICTNCYYYNKWCCFGWGKLSALLFQKGDINKFTGSIGIKFAPAVYGLLVLVPLIAGIISIIKSSSAAKLTVLLLLFLISFYNGAVRRKSVCAECKMKLICPGCAVK